MLPSVFGVETGPCWLGFAAFHSRSNFSLTYVIVTHIPYGPLRGPLSRFDEMNADHLKLLGYEEVLLRLQPVPQFYKEVERTALICDHF